MAREFWEVGQWKTLPAGKRFFIRLGMAKPKDDGGFFINLDALPLQDSEGRCSIAINPPHEKGNYGGMRTANAERSPQQTSQSDNFDDEIPF